MSYYKKEKIEKDFDKGKISVVVTTAALAADVDFPASQVIFDSLVMGNKWINPNEFSQMLGRAGRPSYHDRGIVYLLPEIGYDFDGESEEAKALDLLESNNEDVFIEYDEENFNKLRVKILAIGLQLEMFENAYLSSVVHNQVANGLKIKFSTRLFAESTLDIISSGEAINKVDKKFQEALINIQLDFLKCKCEDRSFCDCLQKGISELIINERLKTKDPIDISNKLFRKYQIQVYPGDIFSWLDSYVKNLDAIKRIGKAFKHEKVEREAHKLIKAIENG